MQDALARSFEMLASMFHFAPRSIFAAFCSIRYGAISLSVLKESRVLNWFVSIALRSSKGNQKQDIALGKPSFGCLENVDNSV